MHPTRRRTPIAALALTAGLLALPRTAPAGCLAPSDTLLDATGSLGPFWASSEGALLHTRISLGDEVLMLRTPARGEEPAGIEEVVRVGETNEFFAGSERQRWSAFHAGTVNADDDLAFVASTVADDDPATPVNEALARRGVYVRRGNTWSQAARFGNPSPVLDAQSQPVPWGTLFETGAADRDGAGTLVVIFSGQLNSPTDRRAGVFRWNELDPAAPVPLALTGDPAPDGGAFDTIGRLRVNGPGDVVFSATTRATPGGPTEAGLFLVPAGGGAESLTLVVGTGDPAPGGGTFSAVHNFDVDDAGTVHLAASLDGGGGGSALFRVGSGGGGGARFVRSGEASALGGQYDTFRTAQVRASADGETVFGVTLSADVGGDGVFTIPAGGTDPIPLVNPDTIIGLAALGEGAVAYLSDDGVHRVRPADGTEEGPTDFRIVKLDLKNSVPLRSDSIVVEGRFVLPPWGVAPPAVFPAPEAVRFAPDRRYEGAELTGISQVAIAISQSPGNNFLFGVSGSTATTGTLHFNGNQQDEPKVKTADDGSAATWSFNSPSGAGKLTVDLAGGTFRLKTARGNVQPSFDPRNFRLAFTLKSLADVAQARPDEQSFFHRDLRIAASAPKFGKGRRVVSKGEGVTGGTFFVDSLRVVRKLKVQRGQAAPQVDSDSVTLSGTIRVCPGSTLPRTPTLAASFTLGDLVFDDVTMQRVGRGGSKYQFVSDDRKVAVRVDAAAATFSLKAKAVAPLSQLVNADFSGSHATNDSRLEVGGMDLPFSMSVARLYEASVVVPMVRRPGGRVFER